MASSGKPSTHIYSTERSLYKWVAFIGAAFLVFTAPVMFAIPKELAQGNQGIWFALVFPLTGVGICFAAWKVRKKYLLLGATPLLLSPAIGQVGGQIGGEIQMAQPKSRCRMLLRLSCIHTYSSGSGDNSSTQSNILWQQETRPYATATAEGCVLKFCFDVPDDQPLSGKHKRRGTIKWQVMIEGMMEYQNFKRHWTIPVELGDQRSSIALPEQHVIAVQKEAQQQAKASIEKQIDIHKTAQGLNILSDQGRNASMSLFACGFGFIFTAVSVFLFYLAWQGELMLWLMAPMFFVVGSGIFSYGIFLVGRKLECKLVNNKVFSRRSFFGRIIYRREAELTSADQLILKVMMSSQQGSIKTEYMAIYAQVLCADGKQRKLKLVEGIEGRAAGEEMLKQISVAISLNAQFT